MEVFTVMVSNNHFNVYNFIYINIVIVSHTVFRSFGSKITSKVLFENEN